MAVLLVAVLHFLAGDDNPGKIVGTLMSAMPPGSYLVISHITGEQVAADASRDAQAVYAHATGRVHPRTRAEITRFFDGLHVIEPGTASPPAAPDKARRKVRIATMTASRGAWRPGR